jgi:hypothetical protein
MEDAAAILQRLVSFSFAEARLRGELMTRGSSARRIAGLAAGLVVVVFGTTLVGVVDGRSPGVRAHEWAVKSAAAGTLPSKLKDLAPYSAAFRTAAFNALGSPTKSEVAREHYELFRIKHHLTTEQDAVIREILSVISPSAYEASGQDKARQALKAICATIPRLFTADQRTELGVLGYGVSPPPRDRL